MIHRVATFCMLSLLAFTIDVSAHEGAHDAFARAFAKPIEKAHGYENWKAKKAIRYNIDISFGGKTTFSGNTIFEIGAERVRMENDEGMVMVWDGNDAWYTPVDAHIAGPGPRFVLRTWTYFLAAPFKLRDPGTHLHELPDAPLMEGKYPALERARLTFGQNVGDAPDDWYVVYRQANTDRLAAMSYIVTYAKSTEEAEAEPHAIVYKDYKRVGGVMLSTRWEFYHWSEQRGIYGEPIGQVKISDISFIEPPEGLFARPSGAARDPLPGE